MFGKNNPKKASALSGNESKLAIGEQLVNEAQKQGWMATDKELKFVIELLPMQNNALDYFLKFMFQQLESDPQMITTYTYLISKYLFAKSVESVIIWGHSTDGKISILYHPRHLVEGQLEFEIPKSLEKKALDSLKVGESLFQVYNDYVMREINNGRVLDIVEYTKELFSWIQKLGIHYALESKYELLWGK